LVDKKDVSAINSKSVNTILFDSNKMIGYNTDYYATEKILVSKLDKFKEIFILGNGGLSNAVISKSKEMGFLVNNITRNNWGNLNLLKNSLIFNCTPVTNIVFDNSNDFIDCIVGTDTGNLFHLNQAMKQFEIYTGIKYEV
jgi:shikimate 5-dehydrogenase